MFYKYPADMESHNILQRALENDRRWAAHSFLVATTPLYLAAQEGHLEVVNTLINNGADVNQTDPDGFTPLHRAIQKGHLGIVDALIKADADVNQTTRNGITPLHRAAQIGNLEIVDALIKAGADVNQTTRNGITPLYTAAKNGHLEIVDALIKAGADVNQTTKNGISPLYTAAKNGHLEIVDALIKAGADVNPDEDDYTYYIPLCAAAKADHLSVVKNLLKAGADVNLGCPLHLAIENENLDMVNVLLATKGIKVNEIDDDWDSPLYHAACKNNIGILNALLSAEGFVCNDNDIYHIAYLGLAEVFMALLKAKGIDDVNITFEKGLTPLHLFAKSQAEDENIMVLIEAGAVVKPDDSDETPLHHLGYCGCVDLVKAMLNTKGTVSAEALLQKNKQGKSALGLIEDKMNKNDYVYNEDDETVRCLLANEVGNILKNPELKNPELKKPINFFQQTPKNQQDYKRKRDDEADVNPRKKKYGGELNHIAI